MDTETGELVGCLERETVHQVQDQAGREGIQLHGRKNMVAKIRLDVPRVTPRPQEQCDAWPGDNEDCAGKNQPRSGQEPNINCQIQDTHNSSQCREGGWDGSEPD